MATMVGRRVQYKEYYSPFKLVGGVIVAEHKDRDKRKSKKYEIKPDKPRPTFDGNVFRYHPRARGGVEIEDVFSIDGVLQLPGNV